jgi:23S rRNA (adenine-N6)-dimethyltransferase
VAVRRARGAPPRSRRRHSQHFLRSPALAEAIVREAAIAAGDVVVDVGAGSGRLTAPLAERARHVYAIEADPALAAALRKRFAARPNVTVLEGDALDVALPDRPFRVVANLPFEGSTAILRRLLDSPPLERADVIVEWEAARKRAVCWPSTALGVCWGARFEFVLVRRLPAGCFEPRPLTHAGVLRIIRRPEPLVADRDYGRFCAFVRAAFARDRALSSALGGRAYKRAMRAVGLDRSARPRDLDAHQWAALFAAVRSSH